MAVAAARVALDDGVDVGVNSGRGLKGNVCLVGGGEGHGLGKDPVGHNRDPAVVGDRRDRRTDGPVVVVAVVVLGHTDVAVPVVVTASAGGNWRGLQSGRGVARSGSQAVAFDEDRMIRQRRGSQGNESRKRRECQCHGEGSDGSQ